MQFKFDANQEFQLDAIDAITDLFDGQRHQQLNLEFKLGQIPAVANQLDLSESDLLANLQAVQLRNFRNNGRMASPNHYQPDSALKHLIEKVEIAGRQQTVRFPNFSIEMETGTGKTYVYLRTALDLFKQYGFRKFIVVVPSVAIREGVIKTLQITRQHFSELYDNAPYRFSEYNSDNLSQVRQFALSDSLEFLVMTLAAFNKADKNVIHQTTDRLQGETPVHLIQAVRPILILDEPQNMESEKAIAALATLNPLFALRYSATHKVPYNVVYRLTPADAYRLRLVKRIEVSGVTEEDNTLKPYIKLLGTDSKKNTLTASVVINQQFKNGRIAPTTITVKPGDSLEQKSGGRAIYASYTIDEINDGFKFVRFGNTRQLNVGEEIGGSRSDIFEGQIMTTIEEHFRKQAVLRPLGIKVLSLFFIDRVDNYAPEEGTGLIKELFDKAFNTLKVNFPEWKNHQPDEVQAGYFAQRRTRQGEVVFEDTKTGTSIRDKEAYELIMRDKERLLSFNEPVAFIFSHSALREGWDNPNIFQICTLNQSVSETRKRQEVGRGVRLCVNQTGERVPDDRINVLTVIANESYERFVTDYQNEISQEYYQEIENRFGKPLDKLTPMERQLVEAELGPILPPPPANARERAYPKLRKEYTLKPEFQALWQRISQKTRYRVTVDTETLIKEVTEELKKVTIPAPRVSVTKAKVDLDTTNVFQAWQMSAAKTLLSLAGRYPLPNLVDEMLNLMENTSPPMRLTRRTLLEIIRLAPHPQSIVDNPSTFAAEAVRIIKQKLGAQLVSGIQYEKINDWYQMELFDDELKAWKEYIEPAQHALYDQIICDSEVERNFVRALEHRDDVKLYVKLPDWFKVPTPIGNYNPDWAIVMEDPNDPQGELVYLISETKGQSRQDLDKLRFGHEAQKIHCGERHFEGALAVSYQVVKDAGELRASKTILFSDTESSFG